MAKANITTKSGLKVSIEGTVKEVADLVAELQGDKVVPSSDKPKKGAKKAASDNGGKPSLVNLITDLIDGGFFGKPRELSAIKTALAEQGYHYPVTSLSPAVLRLVRKRQLRRLKEKKRWLYVQ